MKLAVPTNWQPDLLDKLNKTKIAEVYGKLKSDIVGGARPAAALPDVSKKSVEKYIAAAHGSGLQFNYLLNSTCLGNIELTRKGQRQIRQMLDWLARIKVDTLTVAIPYLLQVIKKSYPMFRVNISYTAGVDSVVKAKYWQELGADEIVLYSADLSRNFALLGRIRKATSCSLQLIANLPCLYGCPFYKYHGSLISHASQSADINKGFFINYCALSCRYLKLLEPGRLISSGWIRPEDIGYYEQIGINKIKLVDRIMNTQTLVNIVEAYTLGRYEGNLLDLFNFDMSKHIVFSKKYFFRKLKYLLNFNNVDLFRLYRYSQLTNLPEQAFLDNQKLDGFIRFFIDGKCDGDCDNCGYCQKTAEKAFYIPADYRAKVSELYRDFLDDMISGRLFMV